MKQTIKETVVTVLKAPSSIFSKEDVVALLNNLQAADSVTKFDQQMITDLIEKITDQIKDNANGLDSSDVVDKDSAEFELNGNEIELTHVDIDTKNVRDAIVDNIGEVIEEFFKELGEESDVVELERG